MTRFNRKIQIWKSTIFLNVRNIWMMFIVFFYIHSYYLWSGLWIVPSSIFFMEDLLKKCVNIMLKSLIKMTDSRYLSNTCTGTIKWQKLIVFYIIVLLIHLFQWIAVIRCANLMAHRWNKRNYWLYVNETATKQQYIKNEKNHLENYRKNLFTIIVIVNMHWMVLLISTVLINVFDIPC